MSESKSPRVELRADDQERMQSLSEEVRSRLEEMALIIARNAGIELYSDAVRKFVPVNRAENVECTETEIIDLPDGTSGCYVECDDGSGFSEYPCGAAG